METYLYKFLKKKCEEKGFVYGRLEDKADLSHSVVQAIRNDRTQLKPATKQKLAQALGCSIGDIQDAIRRSDEVLENGEVLKKQVPEEPVTVPEPEPHCPYDDPVEEPAAGPQDKPWIPEKEMPEKAGQKICVLGKVVPMDEPDCLKENPEATEAAVIQQLANDVIREDEPAIADMVKAAVPRFDNVNHPSHYTQGAVECIDALKASMTKEEFIGYLKGCQMKYVWRYRMKGGVEDLRKARWYLDRLISEVEKV